MPVGDIVEVSDETISGADDVMKAAFGHMVEAQLTHDLRDGAYMLDERVVLQARGVVGYGALSRAIIRYVDNKEVAIAALAPLAVSPSVQREGIGFALAQTLISAWQENGNGAVIVLGHPPFYRRLGFSASLAERHLISPFPEAGDAFMLSDPAGVLCEITGGHVEFPAPFGVGVPRQKEKSA